MGFIELQINKDDIMGWLQEKIDGLPLRGADLVREVVNLYGAIAETLAPYRSGELRDSHRIEASGLTGSMMATAAHAIFVVMGTDPHPIVAVHKSALYWPGALHPVVRVQHPGTRPNDYIEEAATTGDAEVDNLIDALGDWVVM